MSTAEDTLVTLLNARTLLATEGWCQGEYQSAAGSYCAYGAISEGSDGWMVPVITAADAIKETVGEQNLVAWNDSPRRSKAQVLKAFDKTIARLEREVGP